MPPGDAASVVGPDRTAVALLARRHGCRTARRGRLAVGSASSRTRRQLVIKIHNLYIILFCMHVNKLIEQLANIVSSISEA